MDRDPHPHLPDPDLVVLERCQPERNMARFYVMQVEAGLFGDSQLLRRWGRIGARGREIRSHYPSRDQARAALGLWLAAKLKRGYALVHG